LFQLREKMHYRDEDMARWIDAARDAASLHLREHQILISSWDTDSPFSLSARNLVTPPTPPSSAAFNQSSRSGNLPSDTPATIHKQQALNEMRVAHEESTRRALASVSAATAAAAEARRLRGEPSSTAAQPQAVVVCHPLPSPPPDANFRHHFSGSPEETTAMNANGLGGEGVGGWLAELMEMLPSTLNPLEQSSRVQRAGKVCTSRASKR
jgi:hypothetical protein